MKHCPITYEPIADNKLYSQKGLMLLSRNLSNLLPLPFTAQEQRDEAAARVGKISIQGVQPKLSAILKIKESCFRIVDKGGRYILKPQCDYAELPQNEALTMSMAEMIDLEIPLHGLLYSKDGSFTYFIKRFDRIEKSAKLPLEDFAQLSGKSRETKYNSSMEKIAGVIVKYTTFPAVENIKLFKLLLFSFLTGNEDMHLKNFSLITRDGKTELSPVYDLVNSTIVLPHTKEELALPLNGKKANLKKSDFIDYFGMKCLGLNKNIIDITLERISGVIYKWKELISVSFLSDTMKTRYEQLLMERSQRLCLIS